MPPVWHSSTGSPDSVKPESQETMTSVPGITSLVDKEPSVGGVNIGQSAGEKINGIYKSLVICRL